MKQPQVHITTTPELRFILKELANEDDRSLSYIGKKALEEYFAPKILQIRKQIEEGKLLFDNGEITSID